MYASIRRYRSDPAVMDELLHLIDTDFAETVEEIDGFVAYECIDNGAGELCTISVFRDEAAALASVDAAAAWVRDNLRPSTTSSASTSSTASWPSAARAARCSSPHTVRPPPRRP